MLSIESVSFLAQKYLEHIWSSLQYWQSKDQESRNMIKEGPKYRQVFPLIISVTSEVLVIEIWMCIIAESSYCLHRRYLLFREEEIQQRKDPNPSCRRRLFNCKSVCKCINNTSNYEFSLKW